MPSFANCTKLRVLDVSSNNLVGQISVDLPAHLHKLLLSHNNLTGIIPTSLANITTLAAIDCRYNHIKGNIPSEFAHLSSLQYLYVGANQLAGRFPQTILNISTLTGLGLFLDGLSGELPPILCTSLPNLQILVLGGNFFVGNIPSSLTNSSNLYNIDLSELTKLSLLNLEENKLQAHSRVDWEFLDSLGNCTKLQIFSMTMNHLSVHVPSSLGNLSNQLQRLYLAKNQLSGNFPSIIANLPNLIGVALSGNHFTGVVPEWIGTLNTLQQIGLAANFFTGVIPSSFSNLSQLGSLSLYSNQFIGHIPPNFGNFPMLQYLDISNNNLHGTVPMEIFRIPSMIGIDLSFNNLDKQLPTNIGNAKQLVYFRYGCVFLTLAFYNVLHDIPDDDSEQLIQKQIIASGLDIDIGMALDIPNSAVWLDKESVQGTGLKYPMARSESPRLYPRIRRGGARFSLIFKKQPATCRSDRSR
ncbi:uncharacterized protein [Aegilops tauschii subsp. strangulata]|uniref:uncharacterized protein n=1 Tax=Aegilops tauschii subsp. strangulata TaxID=200361 RepID=UPI003CC8B0D8